MNKRFFTALFFSLALGVSAEAQNTNTAPARRPIPRATPRTLPTPTSTPATVTQEQTPATNESAPRTRSRRTGATTATTGQTRAAEPGATAVRAVFDTLVKNIERSDVDAVMALYWNSPQLTVFNNNGTVTRGWAQVRSNRASSYPEAKNVKIEARDVKVQMLGASGAIVTCLWHQSQEFRGTPEAAAGRLTVVFRLINQGWKIVHTHSSPEAPDPSRLAPSEQTTPARPSVTPPPR
ncbi:MAG: L-asparaginase / beta-aspartyl-peptidase [Acidobacteriota bacterium]|jgi:ketosteroid isomerase-like protein|nr:L-asparaginase / beta-aspartyl-peptidase [Acidobacteriota bacterium]